MDIEDKKKYIERYTDRFNVYGHDPRSLGWGGDLNKQNFRFSVMAAVGDLQGKSILDLGCGFGDFYGFLKSRAWEGEYLGIDIVPVLLETARRKWPEAKFKEMDVLNASESELEADYVIASGLFGAKIQGYGGNENYIKLMLEKMLKMCRVGLAVDFISTYVDYQQPLNYHTQPEWVFRIAKEMTKRVCLRHDYMPFEFCLYIYKQDKIGRNNVFV